MCDLRDDLSLNDVCFNCIDGYTLSNRKLLSQYSRLLKKVFQKCPNIECHTDDPFPKKCIILDSVLIEDLESLFAAISKNDFIEVEMQRMPGIRRTALILGIALHETSHNNNDAVQQFKAVQLKMYSVEIRPESKSCQLRPLDESETLEKNADTDKHMEGDRKVEEQDLIDNEVAKNDNTDSAAGSASNDIRFNCDDGYFFGNRKQLSMYSEFLKQHLFVEFPSIGYNQQSPIDECGINLPTVNREDMQSLLQSVNEDDFVELTLHRMIGVRKAACMLRMKLTEELQNGELLRFKALRTETDESGMDVAER